MSDDIPNWENMPDPSPLVTLNWEDVWESAKMETQDKFQRDPTQDEVTAIFDTVDRKADCEAGTVRDAIDDYVADFYSRVDK